MIKKKTTFILAIVSLILVLLVFLVSFIIFNVLSEKKNSPLFSKLYQDLSNEIDLLNKENKDELTIETKHAALNNNDSQTLVQVLNLSKKYNRKSKNVIDNLNFETKSGEFHAFIGANGVGKTTNIKAIVGAYANFEEQILINGFENHTALAKERIDYIPEKAVFPKNMNTFEYLVTMAG